MARKNYFLSEKLIEQRIKDGRGQGYGEKYQPWLRVQDVPSDGRSHRIFSHKTKRIHHLLSDLELATFLLFDWSESVLDIREQFPLIRDDTRIIAQREGIKHPAPEYAVVEALPEPIWMIGIEVPFVPTPLKLIVTSVAQVGMPVMSTEVPEVVADSVEPAERFGGVTARPTMLN